MKQYVPVYEPSHFEGDPEAHRQKLITPNDDTLLFTHVGHYVTWYAIAEFFITMLLWGFTGKMAADDFHALTLGMDAKVKAQRLRSICKREDIPWGENLKKRVDHFERVHVPLRNKIVHNYLYWPEGDTLQICSIGALPAFEGFPRDDSAPPEMVRGLLLMERGLWLTHFAHDLSALIRVMPKEGRPPRGTGIEIGAPLSSLPKDGQTRPG